MKRFIALFLTAVMLVSTVGCSAGTVEETKLPNSENVEESEQTPQASEDVEDLDGLNVEQNLFDVEITIPASFLDEGITQEDLTKEAEESGFQSATLNEDGSATYVMTHAQHEEMMSGIRESIDQALADMIDPDVYPSFMSIEANADYSEFTVAISSEELGLVESMSVLAFYVYGGMYHAFNGTEVDDIVVSFVNADTGEIIEESHSSEAE